MVAKTVRRGLLLIVMLVTSGSGGTIDFDSIGGGFNPGLSLVTVFNVIRSLEELNEYCTAVNYDTAQLVTKPAFDEKTILALLSSQGGGDRIIYRHIQQIVDEGDTAFLEIRSDTNFFDGGISVQAAYSFILISIPATDKPIFLREIKESLVVKPAVRKIENRFSGRKLQGIYDGQGRLIRQRGGKYPGILVFSRDFWKGKKIILGNRP